MYKMFYWKRCTLIHPHTVYCYSPTPMAELSSCDGDLCGLQSFGYMALFLNRSLQSSANICPNLLLQLICPSGCHVSTGTGPTEDGHEHREWEMRFIALRWQSGVMDHTSPGLHCDTPPERQGLGPHSLPLVRACGQEKAGDQATGLYGTPACPPSSSHCSCSLPPPVPMQLLESARSRAMDRSVARLLGQDRAAQGIPLTEKQENHLQILGPPFCTKTKPSSPWLSSHWL